MHPCPAWRDTGGNQGIDWLHRWLSRKRTILARVVAQAEAAWAAARSRTRHRRRRAGLLESARRGLADHARTALLGAQDSECLEQAAQVPAFQSQAGASGNLDGRNQSRRPQSL